MTGCYATRGVGGGAAAAVLVCVASVRAYAPRVCRAVAQRARPSMSASVGKLWSYPIKGFPADALESVALEVDGALPFDRRWAPLDVEDAGGWNASAPAWVHKQHFFGAFRSGDKMNTLNTSFSNGVLRLDGAAADLATAEGIAMVEQEVSRRVGRRVELVTGGERHHFGNTARGFKNHGDIRTLHIVNAASVAAVRAATGLDVDASVFRPNVVLEGVPAWAEEAWVGKRLSLGGAVLEIISRTVRCDAINFQPRTGERWPGGRDLVTEIATHFPEVGPYLGVYARVVGAGTASLGA
eukprot:CAMPEP_0119282150 /NCGR_PEP_ID=MMETSP1329-20130426/26176_1 /TAXON_ID=114041 /ORGANISM="Genus nov. species nov., Strain RCC1024" /LENGTH=296 /DNA_ID=CAMNT_0007282797 /DNA_START=235 /DNA_END=1122 /DNA_ORIENTATION=-